MLTQVAVGLLIALVVALAVALGSSLLGVETGSGVAVAIGAVAAALYVAAQRRGARRPR